MPAAGAAPDREAQQSRREERREARRAEREARTAARIAPAPVASVAGTVPEAGVAVAAAAAAPSVTIDKFVDPIPQFEGQLVTVSVKVTNTSPVPVTITSLTDSDLTAGTTTPICAALVGMVLQPGESRTCTIFFGPAKLDDQDRARVVVATEDGATAAAEDNLHWNLASEGLPPKLSVVKTNDADGDGGFADVETAPTPGAPVPFHVVIQNIGPTPITITGVTDEFPGMAAFAVCPSLAGVQLVPNQSVTCDFTVAGYAPPGGTSIVDLVRVRGLLFSFQLEANDPSTVNTRVQPVREIVPPAVTPPPGVTLPLPVAPAPAVVPAAPRAAPAAPPAPAAPSLRAAQVEALAFTGGHTIWLSVVGGVALVLGLAVLKAAGYAPARPLPH